MRSSAIATSKILSANANGPSLASASASRPTTGAILRYRLLARSSNASFASASAFGDSSGHASKPSNACAERPRLASAVVTFHAQEAAGRPVDAVRQVRKTQHGRCMCHGKQLQEKVRLIEERSRIVARNCPVIARPGERGPPLERSDRRPDRPEAMESRPLRSKFLHQILVHERPHLLKWKQCDAIGDVDSFAHREPVEQRRVVSDIQPVRQCSRFSVPGRSEKRVKLAGGLPKPVAAEFSQPAPSVRQSGSSGRAFQRYSGYGC